MHLGQCSRKVGIEAKQGLSKDEHSMENIDDYFEDTENRTSNSGNDSVLSTKSILGSLSQSEINIFNSRKDKVGDLRRKKALYIKDEFSQKSQNNPNRLLDIDTHSGYLEDEREGHKEDDKEQNKKMEKSKSNRIRGGSAGYDNLVTMNSTSVPNLTSDKGDMTYDDTSFNTSENALLEEEVDDYNNSDELTINSCIKVSSNEASFEPTQNKGTAKRENASVSNEKNIRRSKRVKIPKLEFWKNERVVYQRTTLDPILEKSDVITDDSQNTRVANHKYTKKSRLKHNEISLHLNNRSEPEVVASVPSCSKYKKIKTDRENYVITNLFDKKETHFGSGIIKFPINGRKQLSHSDSFFITIHITQGIIEVNLSGNTFECRKGSSVLIPPKNTYIFRNIGNKQASLFFVQVAEDEGKFM